ncbi:gypsy type transposase [Tanacetum coccineum]
MLGKAQLDIQKLVHNYRSHISQTIANSSESLLNELRTVEDIKKDLLCITVSSRSGSLVGQRSTCNRVCGREYSSAVSVLPQSITSLKCVLTQEHLDAICAKYFVLEEVHPQLPSPDSTMHERPTGKVGMYTRVRNKEIIYL